MSFGVYLSFANENSVSRIVIPFRHCVYRLNFFDNKVISNFLTFKKTYKTFCFRFSYPNFARAVLIRVVASMMLASEVA